MKKIIENYKSNKLVWITFLFIFVIRLVFFLSCTVLQTSDSIEYIGANGFDIFQFKLDEYRVPLYPLLIEIFQRLFGGGGLLAVCILQFCVSFVSAVYLFKTFLIFSRKKYVSLFFLVLYACSLIILGWDKTILTESFALSLTVFFIYLLARYLKDKKISAAIGMTVIVIIGTFMRPTFLLYAILIAGFFALRLLIMRKERILALQGLLVSCIPILLVLCYSALFYQQHQQFTLSNSLLGQQVSVMKQTGLYTLSSDKEIVKAMDAVGDDTDPILARVRVMSLFPAPRVSKFVNEIEYRHFFAYAKGMLKTLWKNSTDTFISYFDLQAVKAVKLWGVYYRFEPTINFIQGVYIGAICLLLFLLKGIRRKIFDWVYFGIGCFILSILVTAILGTNAEYPRTAITAIPFIIFALYLFTIKITDLIRKTKNVNLTGENIEL